MGCDALLPKSLAHPAWALLGCPKELQGAGSFIRAKSCPVLPCSHRSIPPGNPRLLLAVASLQMDPARNGMR